MGQFHPDWQYAQTLMAIAGRTDREIKFPTQRQSRNPTLPEVKAEE
jgi:hypothetical protein